MRMIKLFLELGTCAKVAVIKDTMVICYEELELNNDILNKLHNRLRAYDVDEFIVVHNGILSKNVFQGSYRVYDMFVSGNKYDCYVSKSDVDRLVYLANSLGIKNVRMYDKLGYYLTIKGDAAVFVDTAGSAFSCITISNHPLDINYNRYAVLEKVIRRASGVYSIDKIINVQTCYCPELLKAYSNVDGLEPEVLTTLSVFAYTSLDLADVFRLKLEKLDIDYSVPTRDSNNPFVHPQEDFSDVPRHQASATGVHEEKISVDNHEENGTDVHSSGEERKDLNSSGKKRKVKNSKEKKRIAEESIPKKKKNSGVLGVLSTIFLGLCIILLGIVHFANNKLSSSITALNSEISAINTSLTSVTDTYNEYNKLVGSALDIDYEDYLTKYDGIVKDVDLVDIEFHLDSINLIYKSKSADKFDKVTEKLGEFGSVTASERKEDVKDGKTTYKFIYTVQY